jgi:hypothetical protein
MRGKEIEKFLPTDRAVPTLLKQIQRKYFFDQGISSVKVFFPACAIYKKDSGDENKFVQHRREKLLVR